MSARYSFSPDLRLEIGSSRLRDALYATLCFITGCALFLIYTRGYTILAFLLLPVSVLVLWPFRHNPMLGAELNWRRGVWTLHRNGKQRVVCIGRRSVVLPWVTYLDLTDLLSGSRGGIWLFADSTSAEQRRLLRVRLTLQH